MIARYWSGRAKPGCAAAYHEHFRAHVLPALGRLAGYQGAQLMEREVGGGVTEIVVITTWRSRDAIRAFAGEDIARAVVADEAVPLFVEYDAQVRHYEVAVADPGAVASAGGTS